jgi:O-antigen/teichoic acid export membrane protein
MWSAADFWIQQTSTLLTFLVVGSILGPHVVGVMTMAMSATLFLATFIMGGFADTLIQRSELRKDHFDTVFWLLLAIGIVATLLLALGAPLVARFFSQPDLNLILPVLALSLPFTSVSASYQAILQRELRFRQLATRSILAYTTGFATALVMAKAGMGVWSLVASYLVARVLDATLITLVSRVRPGLDVTRAALTDIVNYGKHRIGSQLLGFTGMQVDRILIGVFLGPVALGLYAIAERIVAAFVFGVSGVVQRIAFPVLSAHQNNRVDFDRALRQFITLGNVISLPIFFGIAVTSRETIQVLFSDTWLPTALPLAILSIGAIVHATNYCLTTATNALGRSDLALRYIVVIIALRVIASLIAAQVSMVAVAFANLTINLISPSIVLTATNKIFGGKWPHYVTASRPALVAALLMIGATMATEIPFSGLPVLALLSIKITVGVVTYLLAIRALAPEIYRGAIALITARA